MRWLCDLQSRYTPYKLYRTCIAFLDHFLLCSWRGNIHLNYVPPSAHRAVVTSRYSKPNSLCKVTVSEPSSLSNPPTLFSPSSLATLLRTVLTFPRFETIVFAISFLKSSSSSGIEMTAISPMMSKRFGVRCKWGRDCAAHLVS
jgi:hypothetical protein